MYIYIYIYNIGYSCNVGRKELVIGGNISCQILIKRDLEISSSFFI